MKLNIHAELALKLGVLDIYKAYFFSFFKLIFRPFLVAYKILKIMEFSVFESNGPLISANECFEAATSLWKILLNRGR